MRVVATVITAATLGSCRQAQPIHRPDLSTYAVNRCGGAARDWQPQGYEYGELMNRNKLEVEAHRLAWNGVPISFVTLDGYLRTVHRMAPSPNLQMVVGQTADCETVRRLRRVIIERLHCGESQSCVEYSQEQWRIKRPPVVY